MHIHVCQSVGVQTAWHRRTPLENNVWCLCKWTICLRAFSSVISSNENSPPSTGGENTTYAGWWEPWRTITPFHSITRPSHCVNVQDAFNMCMKNGMHDTKMHYQVTVSPRGPDSNWTVKFYMHTDLKSSVKQNMPWSHDYIDMCWKRICSHSKWLIIHLKLVANSYSALVYMITVYCF